MLHGIETLESRRLLSVTLDLDPNNATLRVIGSHGPETLELVITPLGDVKPGRLAKQQRPAPVDRALIVLLQDGKPVYDNAEEKILIRCVEFQLQAGDDQIGIVNRATNVNTFVVSGDGNDSIKASAVDAPGAWIIAGTGDDQIDVLVTSGSTAYIEAGDGHDTIRSEIRGMIAGGSIYAGDGNDVISTVALNSDNGFYIEGNDGDDMILGSDLPDIIYGERPGFYDSESKPGCDTLFGEGGDDYLCGCGGDDWLNGGEGFDILDGDDGLDTAISDEFDKLENIEFINPK